MQGSPVITLLFTHYMSILCNMMSKELKNHKQFSSQKFVFVTLCFWFSKSRLPLQSGLNLGSLTEKSKDGSLQAIDG